MSANAIRTDQADPFTRAILVRIPGARDPRDVQSTTNSGLSDIPYVQPGTANLYFDERSFYYSSDPEFSEGESIPTGTSSMGENVKFHLPAIFNYHQAADGELAELELAAARGDEIQFVEFAKGIDLANLSPEQIIRGIQFAFQAGAHYYARRLAHSGLEIYPEHQDLRKYAVVLAPPAQIERMVPRVSGLRKNRDWLRSFGENYRGRWVALRNGELIGSAFSLRELKEAIEDTDEIFLARVP